MESEPDEWGGTQDELPEWIPPVWEDEEEPAPPPHRKITFGRIAKRLGRLAIACVVALPFTALGLVLFFTVILIPLALLAFSVTAKIILWGLKLPKFDGSHVVDWR